MSLKEGQALIDAPETVHTAGADAPSAGGTNEAPAAPRRRWRLRGRVGEWAGSLAGAILLFAVLRGLVVQVYGIQSGSMQPTLQGGDFVVVNHTLFGAPLPFTARTLPALREPRAGDVVVYRPAGYDPPRDQIKRIIGAPGDTVQMVGGRVYRNGRPLDEPYAERTDAEDVPLPAEGPYNFHWQREALTQAARGGEYAPTRDNWGPLVVKTGTYLMLGDQRNGSVDSRHTGFVPRSEIRGKVLLVHWSYGPGGEGSASGVRWNRIGTRP